MINDPNSQMFSYSKKKKLKKIFLRKFGFLTEE